MLNDETLFMSWRRSAIKDVNDWAHSPITYHYINIIFFFLTGFLLLGLFVIICINSYQNKGHNKGQQLSQKSFNSPNYLNHDHHAGEGLFVSAGSKKLQQSSVNLQDDEGVKFLPLR